MSVSINCLSRWHKKTGFLAPPSSGFLRSVLDFNQQELLFSSSGSCILQHTYLLVKLDIHMADRSLPSISAKTIASTLMCYFVQCNCKPAISGLLTFQIWGVCCRITVEGQSDAEYSDDTAQLLKTLLEAGGFNKLKSANFRTRRYE